MHQVVIDIDLDFFVTPAHVGRADNDEFRPGAEDYAVDSKDFVVEFLISRFGLSRTRPIRGKIVKHHKEVFHLWEQLVERGQLRPKFNVVHVDAHDDLVLDPSKEPVSSVNFLSHAVARDWIAQLAFVKPDHELHVPECLLTHDQKHIALGDGRTCVSIWNKSNVDFSREAAVKPADFLFLACSPDFTPPGADALIPLISQFICPL